MKSFNWKNEWFPIATLIAGLGVTWLWFDDLPARVPSHWNIAGQIDGWTTPKGHVLMFLGLMIFMYLLLTAVPYLEPRKENMAKSMSFLRMIKNTMLAFFLGLYTAITYTAVQNAPIHIEKLVSIGVGLMFLAIGAYMPKIKSNYFMGIRTPWTLHSDTIWQKTQRAGSVLFMLAGVAFILGIFIPMPWDFYIPLGFTLAAALIPVVYSYVLFLQEKK